MTEKPIYHFDNLSSLGIDQVPNYSDVEIEDSDGTGTIRKVIKIANTGMTSSSTISNFLSNPSLWREIATSSAWGKLIKYTSTGDITVDKDYVVKTPISTTNTYLKQHLGHQPNGFLNSPESNFNDKEYSVVHYYDKDTELLRQLPSLGASQPGTPSNAGSVKTYDGVYWSVASTSSSGFGLFRMNADEVGGWVRVMSDISGLYEQHIKSANILDSQYYDYGLLQLTVNDAIVEVDTSDYTSVALMTDDNIIIGEIGANYVTRDYSNGSCIVYLVDKTTRAIQQSRDLLPDLPETDGIQVQIIVSDPFIAVGYTSGGNITIYEYNSADLSLGYITHVEAASGYPTADFIDIAYYSASNITFLLGVASTIITTINYASFNGSSVGKSIRYQIADRIGGDDIEGYESINLSVDEYSGAKSDFSGVMGRGVQTAATNTNSPVAVGKFNEPGDDTVFEVGNGTDDSNRSNAFEVYADGGISMASLPTSDPGVPGQLYNSSGTLMISV